jgi:uncharacterized metal-binding protein
MELQILGNCLKIPNVVILSQFGIKKKKKLDKNPNCGHNEPNWNLEKISSKQNCLKIPNVIILSQIGIRKKKKLDTNPKTPPL